MQCRSSKKPSMNFSIQPFARQCFVVILLAILAWLPGWSAAADVRVSAAASLTNALKDVASAWQSGRDDKVVLNFAASSTLAKQIEAGAPADLFISADRKWMDYLDTRKLIERASRRDLLGNALVMIAPANEPRTIAMEKNKVPEFAGKLCMGEPSSVPAGVYGKQALQWLGWWDALHSRVVGAEDVRTALAFVERGECPLGIVYMTDARISSKVMVAGTFPAAAHDVIVYPVALLPLASPKAREFHDFLSSPAARAVFVRYGFVVL